MYRKRRTSAEIARDTLASECANYHADGCKCTEGGSITTADRRKQNRRKETTCTTCKGSGVIAHKCASGCGADANYYPEHEMFICEPCYNRAVFEIVILTMEGKAA